MGDREAGATILFYYFFARPPHLFSLSLAQRGVLERGGRVSERVGGWERVTKGLYGACHTVGDSEDFC